MYYREFNNMSTCPFCSVPAEDILDENEYALAVRDRCPVSEGHTLIITKRHIDDYFKLSIEEKSGTAALLERVKNAVDSELNPDGYNIGMNIGEAAGQKIFHVHIHLIPRMKGETVNGDRAVKGVIRNKISY
jgi:diadenosine tetraphosphate (Ap4A) HIT family hydrolase